MNINSIRCNNKLLILKKQGRVVTSKMTPKVKRGCGKSVKKGFVRVNQLY